MFCKACIFVTVRFSLLGLGPKNDNCLVKSRLCKGGILDSGKQSSYDFVVFLPMKVPVVGLGFVGGQACL
jgi:hypothetical protein